MPDHIPGIIDGDDVVKPGHAQGGVNRHQDFRFIIHYQDGFIHCRIVHVLYIIYFPLQGKRILAVNPRPGSDENSRIP
ncbi:MAG: hypothetical protein U5J62_07440 [Desulfurivibrio sp.]|nr:hypothetical protein [Desulfurivibrio sp.]